MRPLGCWPVPGSPMRLLPQNPKQQPPNIALHMGSWGQFGAGTPAPSHAVPLSINCMQIKIVRKRVNTSINVMLTNTVWLINKWDKITYDAGHGGLLGIRLDALDSWYWCCAGCNSSWSSPALYNASLRAEGDRLGGIRVGLWLPCFRSIVVAHDQLIRDNNALPSVQAGPVYSSKR